MSGVLDKIKDRFNNRQGIWSKVQNFFTMGYGSKEDLREADKALRDNYYQSFKEMRQRWQEVNLAALEAGLKGDDFKKVMQIMDRLMEKVHHADYGYAGLFDRKGSIREEELTQSLDFDKTFGKELGNLESAMYEVYQDYEAENWGVIPAKTKKLRSRILDLEKQWNDREQAFRPTGV